MERKLTSANMILYQRTLSAARILFQFSNKMFVYVRLNVATSERLWAFSVHPGQLTCRYVTSLNSLWNTNNWRRETTIVCIKETQ